MPPHSHATAQPGFQIAFDAGPGYPAVSPPRMGDAVHNGNDSEDGQARHSDGQGHEQEHRQGSRKHEQMGFNHSRHAFQHCPWIW